MHACGAGVLEWSRAKSDANSAYPTNSARHQFFVIQIWKFLFRFELLENSK
jgi:hypothetical protein